MMQRLKENSKVKQTPTAGDVAVCISGFRVWRRQRESFLCEKKKAKKKIFFKEVNITSWINANPLEMLEVYKKKTAERTE